MSESTWRRARELFRAALEQPETERRAFVAAAAGRDEALHREVLSLFEALEEAGGFLAGEHVGVLTDAGSDEPLEVRRDRIGPWRLSGVLGRGGMGVVYLAERDADGFEQRAAIKVVSGGAESAEILRRFQTERRILAALEHPGIARLLDGGTTEDGLPFFVLEHVDGRPLTEHARERALDLRARLALFLEVCAAVDYAHRRLVIHRDLKPANILVAADGRPKLLDFGIAKVLGSDREVGAPPATVTVERWLTPAYASPEQLEGEPTTTATDVYSLGLILFELLTGTSPFGRDRSSAAETERAILEGAIERPSSRVLRGSGSTRRARPETRRLARALRGDLDTIVLKAAALEPERRYGTVAELADEVGRHLAGLPVRARRPTFAYRATRFVLRHRWAVGLAALAGTGLSVGLALALVSLSRAERAEAALRTEAATARRVSDFLAGLFKLGDPSETMGNAVTARELLDRGAERLAVELASEPAVSSRLGRVIAQAYGGLGLYGEQLEVLEKLLDEASRRHGAGSAQAAAARIDVAHAEMRRGRYQAARDLAEAAVERLERAGGPGRRDLARALSQAGLGHWYTGDMTRARERMERSLDLWSQLEEPEPVELVGILNNVAILRWQAGDLDGARPLYERALELSKRVHGEEHPSVAHTTNNLAILELQAKRLDAARQLHESALTLRRRLLAAGHPDIAESLNNLGEVARAAGDFERARALLEEALELRLRALGEEHAQVAATETNLGLALIALGDLDRARLLLERAVTAFGRTLGEQHFHLSYPIEGLGRIALASGRPDEAEASFRRALTLREGGLGTEHEECVALRTALDALMAERGRSPAGAPAPGPG